MILVSVAGFVMYLQPYTVFCWTIHNGNFTLIKHWAGEMVLYLTSICFDLCRPTGFLANAIAPWLSSNLFVQSKLFLPILHHSITESNTNFPGLWRPRPYIKPHKSTVLLYAVSLTSMKLEHHSYSN